MSGNLQSESAPALVNQHILDAVLPLSEQQVMSLVLPVQRGEQEPAQIVEALDMLSNPNSYSPVRR